MNPSSCWNTTQFVYPNYQIASNTNQFEGQMPNNLMNQYCNINPVFISAQYFPTSYYTPSILFDQSQSQQQFQQIQQPQLQQQLWFSNGMLLSQVPQIYEPSFAIQTTQDKVQSTFEESQNMNLRVKNTSETISTMNIEPKTDIIDQIKFENNESNFSNKTKAIMVQEQDNQQMKSNNNNICSQNTFLLQRENQSQNSLKILQQQMSFESLTQNSTEVGNLTNLSNNKPQRFIIECKDQLKITKTDQNENNSILTEKFIGNNIISHKNSYVNSNNESVQIIQESIPQISKIKQEVTVDSVSDTYGQMLIEQTIVSSEQQHFKDSTFNTRKDLEDALKCMQNTAFYKNSELIFSSQYVKQFKLKQSYCKNDDIVFANIKEYRKNKRHQSNESENIQNSTKINSKFHNLNKLFMYKLLATFSEKNLQQLDVPFYLHSILLKLIMNLKQSTKEMKNYNKKTEFFSHDHYNLLFLHLNEKTLKYLTHSSFSIYLHNLCFNLDLSQLDQNNCSSFIKQNQEKIQYINIIKRFCCQIVQNSNMLGVYQESSTMQDEPNKINLSQSNSDSYYDCSQEDEKNGEISPQRNSLVLQISKKIKKNSNKLTEQESSQKQNLRQAYTQRALKGIQSLNQGVIIRRF